MIPPNAHDFGAGGNGSPMPMAHEENPRSLVPLRSGLPAHESGEWSEMDASWNAEAQDRGINVMDFLHGLRRRWLLTSSLAVVLGFVAMGIVWWLVPVHFTAEAVIEVRKDEMAAGSVMNSQDYLRFKETQASLLKGRQVIKSALEKRTELRELPTIYAQTDPEEFLFQELQTPMDQGELIYLVMQGPRSGDIQKIVQAVVDEYKDVVVERAQRDRQETKDLTDRLIRDRETDLSRTRGRLKRLESQLGLADSANAQQHLATRRMELQNLSMRRNNLDSKLRDAEIELRIASYRAEKRKREKLPQEELEAILLNDREYQAANAELARLEAEIQLRSGSLRPGSAAIRQLQEPLRRQQAVVDNMRRRTEKKWQKIWRESPVDSKEVSLLNLKLQTFARAFKTADEEYTKKQQELQDMTSLTTDMQRDEDTVKRLVKVQADLAEKSAALDYQIQSHGVNPPIRVVQQAIVPETSSAMKQIIFVTSTGTIVIAAVIFLVGTFEYLRRRVNTVGDVSQRMGMNLVGTLPALSGRALQRAGASLEAVLTDSIDSIRASLIHGAGQGAHRIVMVTSAEHGEGKTTVASQLAASLARCGRKTLLVDANLRNPALHQLFDLPLESGLGEVLRGETEVQNAIRPTDAERLWLLGAGHANYTSIQALENNNVGQLFARLTAEFEFIIVDTSPVLVYADAMLIGQHVDGAVLSVRLDVSERPKIQESFDRLRSVGVWMFGAVVNGAKVETNGRVVALPEPVEV